MDFISINLNPAAKAPLYLQLHDYLAAEIASGRLQEGERLPGKRTAASQLGISQSTVDGAYQMLASEGYVISKPRSGFVVCKLEQLEPQSKPPMPTPKKAEASATAYSFLTSSIDGSLFPFKTWSRLFKDTLYNRPDLLNHGHPCGDEDLRQSIALYLHHSRGAHCTPDRVIIGAGMEYLLSLLCHLLKGKKIAVEDPGYPKIHQILQTGGMDVCFAGLDENGMNPQSLLDLNAEACYITPSHQFPTGIVSPVGRRTELLKWASQKEGRFIIEDDYDSEFRFGGRPMPCMQALDPKRIIYIGTFSRTIAPAIRVAYMVLPEALMEVYNSDFGFYSSTVSRFEQQTLRRYIDDGHFGRSLNRMRNHYHMQRDLLLAELEGLGEAENTHTGLNFLFYPETKLGSDEIERNARRHGLALRALDSYRFHSKESGRATLVLGFGSLDKASIPTAVAMLARSI